MGVEASGDHTVAGGAEGHFITEYADSIGKDPWEAFFDMCVANNCETGGVYSSMCDEDVCVGRFNCPENAEWCREKREKDAAEGVVRV